MSKVDAGIALDRVMDLLPKPVIDWLRPHLTLTDNPDGPKGMTYLDPSGHYHITLQASLLDPPLTNQHLAVMLRHEFSHVVLGDCKSVWPKDYAPLALIATDIRINTREPTHLVDGMEGVHWDTWLLDKNKTPLFQLAPLLEGEGLHRETASAPAIFKALQKHTTLVTVSQNGNCQVESAGPKDQIAIITEALERLDARSAAEAGGILGANKLPPSIRRYPTLPPAPPDPATMAAHTLFERLCGTALEDTRSRLRSRRNHLGLLLPSHARRRRPNILVALDASGSMHASDPVVARVLSALTSRGALISYTAHSDCSPSPLCQSASEARQKDPGGGGTLFQPLYESKWVREADALVHITDGYCFDKPALPGCPLIVCLTPQGQWGLGPPLALLHCGGAQE